MFATPVNSPAQPNVVWARNPHGGGYIQLLCHPQTIDKVMELGLQLLEGSFQLIYNDAPEKLPPPPGDAECRKVHGMPPHPDEKDDIFKQKRPPTEVARLPFTG